MPRRLVLASLVAMLIVVPSAAHARTSIRVGIGDQNVSMFGQNAFERAKFKRVRYLVPWTVMDDAQQRLAARAYVKRAGTAGMQLLLHVSTDDYRIKRARRPSVTTVGGRSGGSSATSARWACATSAPGTKPTTPASRPGTALPAPRCSSARCTGR